MNKKSIIDQAKLISEMMLEKKAVNIKIIDVRDITTLTDIFIICTSNSNPQTKAISDNINQKMKIHGLTPWHIEGYETLDWVLIDYVNIVIHIFNSDTRNYYNLENLWADGKITLIEDSYET